jgi:hypothetical protein
LGLRLGLGLEFGPQRIRDLAKQKLEKVNWLRKKTKIFIRPRSKIAIKNLWNYLLLPIFSHKPEQKKSKAKD